MKLNSNMDENMPSAEAMAAAAAAVPMASSQTTTPTTKIYTQKIMIIIVALNCVFTVHASIKDNNFVFVDKIAIFSRLLVPAFICGMQ